MLGKDHALLERIREARKELKGAGSGVRMLPVVRYERKLWFFDERLRQLRDVENPHDFMDLDESDVEYFRWKEKEGE